MSSSCPSARCLVAALLTLQVATAQSPPAAAPAREPSEHWAFVAPVAPDLPVIDGDGWSRDPIDRFVRRRLATMNLQPSPRADKRTLIRRLSFDLTGLPPTRDEVRAFVADDAEDAYERLVDRLLASPHYGEHMARYWLDLVRFADTNGVHHDHYREMTPYRDWVIRAFHDNLPYDQFATDQIAGDLHPDATDEQRIASGFHRLHMIIDRGTALPEESRARNVIDRVTAFGTAFLGLTVHCAVCHDHKYDPITQRDFFGLYAFFNNLDGAPETGSRGTSDFHRGLQPPYISFPSQLQSAVVRDLESEVAAAEQNVTKLRQAAKTASDATRREELEAEQQAAQQELTRRRRELGSVLKTIPAAMVMKERAEIRPAHIFIRGAYDNLGEHVDRDTPAFLPPTPRPADGQRTRVDLARWLVSPAHPLTARVAVNRFWQQFFGTGLVATAEDLGTQGERPSHPELLDHLACAFVASGWDVKALVRRIVLSATYQQSANAATAAFANDPDNRLLARGSRYRMDAEMIRDQILATSGLLDPTLFGKSVKPPQPAGIWRTVTLPDSLPRTYEADTGDAIYRRSLYTFWKRGMPPPQMTILNAPARESCIARRERTNTPLQALLLLNEREYLKAARQLAYTTLATAEPTDSARLRAIYETITSMVPDAEETATLLVAVRDLRAMYARESALAAELCSGVELGGELSATELAAWTMLASTVYNLDVTRTRQ